MRMIALAALALTGACTAQDNSAADIRARGDREFAAAVEGRVPGKPERCINPQTAGGP